MKNHIFPAFLLLAAVMTAAIGCGDSDTGPVDGTAVMTGTTDTTAVTETENIYANDLGDYDFGGDVFTMYTRDVLTIHDNMDTEATDGSTINDELYARNARLEEKYNFTFAEVLEENTTDKARTAVIAGEDTYDIITTRCVYAFNYALEGLLYPVTDLPHIDLSKPYWDEELTDAVSIGNTRYFAVGAYNLSGYDFTHLLAFNKEIASHNDFDIYSEVRNGTWTYAKMQEMMKAVVSDTDGDGDMDEYDRYGLLSSSKQILPNFWIAANETSIDFDANDYPVYSLVSDERFTGIFEKIFDLVYENDVWYVNNTNQNVPAEQVTMFINGQSLFIDMGAFYLEDLRTMDTDFGLIPYPKYDEAQDAYYSRIEGCEQTCIPVTNGTLEMTSVILEAMASDSAQNLVPAYYDVLLKGKHTRDNESEEMLEVIFGNRVFDWGDTIWCEQLRDGKFYPMMYQNKRDLASTAKSMEKTMTKLINETIEAFEELNK